MTTTSTQNSLTFISESPADLDKAANNLLTAFPDTRIFTFTGTLGAGKTTFIKAICRQLGVNDPVSSPTFSIINEYRGAENKPVYHFDFYRINSAKEAEDTGCVDYFFSGNYCFIEWPQIAESLLPPQYVRVDIKEEEQKRIINAY